MNLNEEKINKLFINWLYCSFSIVFLIIIVGGLTRLTNSGLSITEWELFEGIFPPMNNKSWNNYFDLYKQIPQYQLLNSDMTLKEFKIIFYWEYFHRVLGRVIGLFFLVPLIYFYLTKKINKEHLSICYLIFLLIVIQGVIGWFMVKSGLVNNTTVSHYRLSLHLSLAFIIISMIFWLIINIKNNSLLIFSRKKYNFFFYLLIFMIFLQIIIGAFVSGLDAGRIYQTWPLMNYSYYPDNLDLRKITNLLDFNNHGLVQFYHRNLAYFIITYTLLLGLFIYYKKMIKLYRTYLIFVFFLILQIILGITTLISGLNIFVASAHQICSLLLTLSSIYLYFKYVN